MDKKKTSLMINANLWNEVKIYAIKNNKNIYEIIEQFIDEGLKRK